MTETQFLLFDQPVMLDDKFRFVVTMKSGEILKGVSMSVLEKKAKAAMGHDTFPVLIWSLYGKLVSDRPFDIGTVVGTAKTKGHYPDEFRFADGKRAGTVTLDTPNNRKKLRKLHKLREREADLDREMALLVDSLETRNTRSFISKKVTEPAVLTDADCALS